MKPLTRPLSFFFLSLTCTADHQISVRCEGRKTAMLTATIAVVLSTWCKPSCSLDIFHPCILDEVDTKSEVDRASWSLKNEAVSTDTRHPIEGVPLSARKISRPREEGHLQQELSQPRQTGLHPTRQEAATSHRQDEPDRISSRRALRSRIERFEARYDRCKLDIPKPALEAVQCMVKSQGIYESSNGRDGDKEDLSCNPVSQKTVNTKRRRQRLIRSVGASASQPLPNTYTKAEVSAKVRSRKRRALDLGISGTPKFKLADDGERASRPKLVRLQNRWCRIGRR